MNFVIQFKEEDITSLLKKENKIILPAYEFCYAAINAINYHNWWFFTNHTYTKANKEHINLHSFNPTYDDIPVGSVEFCLDFYHKLNKDINIKPLNIPKELLKYTKRKCIYFKNILEYNEDVFPYPQAFVKSANQIKDSHNKIYVFNNSYDYKQLCNMGEIFVSEYIQDVVSEWRVFVYNGKIEGIKCYSGDEWILPDKEYINIIISNYNKKAYTLDVMIDERGNTDILELHDFFACGTYGFDSKNYVNMLIASHRDIIKDYKINEITINS